ncbi:thiamine phosphate synthase [Arthrobacter pigmenti]
MPANNVDHDAAAPQSEKNQQPSTAAQLRTELAAARLYVCTDARRRQGDFADFVDAAFSGGVDILQLRDKTIDAAEELDYFAILGAAARRHGKLFSANDRADIASLAGAPVFHGGQTDLPVSATRTLLGPDPLVGISTHTPDQVDDALDTVGLDYFCTGPVWETPTKPGRTAAGLELVEYAAQRTSAAASNLPWFAIGGIGLGTIEQVVAAGAQRVVVVRAVTEADDPAAAARALRSALPAIN